MSKKATPAPPTVLVITLNADGTGSILTRRGDLGHLSQFTYSGLVEIVTAIQSSATELMSLEANPPATEITSTPTEVQPEGEPETETTPDETSEEALVTPSAAPQPPLMDEEHDHD